MWAILWREIRLHYIKGYWLVANFATPLFYLIFFGFLFSNFIPAVPIGDRVFSYLHFFIPGLLVMQSFQLLSSTLALVNLDRRTGIIDMINMTSSTLTEYYAGRALGAQLQACVKAVLIAVLAATVFRMPLPAAGGLILAIVAFVIGNILWFNVGMVLGLLIKTEDIRDIVLEFLTLPLTFLSNVYYLIGDSAGLLKYIVGANPLTHMVNIIRPALLGLPGTDWTSALVLIGYLAVSTVVAVSFVHRWSAQRE